MTSECGLVVAKLDDDVALRRLATSDDMLAAANQKARSVFRKRRGVGLDVFLIALGIMHVDMDDPVAFGHEGSYSKRGSEPSRLKPQSSQCAWPISATIASAAARGSGA